MLQKRKAYFYLALSVTILFLMPLIAIGEPIKQNYHVILDDGNITDHIWSSDGTKIAYIKSVDGESWKGELWIADWSDEQIKNERLIYAGIDTGRLEDWQGSWILLMIRQEEGDPAQYYGRNELWKIRDDGTDLTQVTFTFTNGIRRVFGYYYKNIGTVSWGRFIPGTDLVYFSAHDGNGWYKAFTSKNDGTDQWILISGNYYSFTIGMSPTGNKLLWGHASYWNNPTTLMASNVDGTNRVTLNAFSKRTFPLVLADGKTVIWSWNDGNIHAIDIDGSNIRTVIDDEYNNYWANYNPVEGQELLMISNRDTDGNNHIFSIKVDGTSIVQQTEGPYNDVSPFYSPNGRYILYRRQPLEGDTFELVVTKVVDVVNPWSSHPDDQIVGREDPDVNITWQIFDNGISGAYIIYRNGTVLGYPQNWKNEIPIVLPVDTGKVGTWNYTISYSDEAGNPGIPDIVLITVIDVKNPWSSHPDDQTVDRKEHNIDITWYLYDDVEPNSYTVLRNGTIVAEPTLWTNTSAIVIPVDTREVGIWNYTIYFSDAAGNKGIPDTVLITVIDAVNPWSSHPDDQTVDRKEHDVNITWYLYDDVEPGTYSVFCNGTIVAEPTVWTNTSAIVIPVDTNEIGIWNYTIIYTDAAGNSGIPDTALITVIDAINPWSSQPDDQIVGKNELVNITWILYDDVAPGAYIVFCNGKMVTYPLIWTNTSTIVIPVVTSKAGNYNYAIYFTDAAGNLGIIDTVWIIVLKNINP